MSSLGFGACPKPNPRGSIPYGQSSAAPAVAQRDPKAFRGSMRPAHQTGSGELIPHKFAAAPQNQSNCTVLATGQSDCVAMSDVADTQAHFPPGVRAFKNPRTGQCEIHYTPDRYFYPSVGKVTIDLSRHAVWDKTSKKDQTIVITPEEINRAYIRKAGAHFPDAMDPEGETWKSLYRVNGSQGMPALMIHSGEISMNTNHNGIVAVKWKNSNAMNTQEVGGHHFAVCSRPHCEGSGNFSQSVDFDPYYKSSTFAVLGGHDFDILAEDEVTKPEATRTGDKYLFNPHGVIWAVGGTHDPTQFNVHCRDNTRTSGSKVECSESYGTRVMTDMAMRMNALPTPHLGEKGIVLSIMNLDPRSLRNGSTPDTIKTQPWTVGGSGLGDGEEPYANVRLRLNVFPMYHPLNDGEEPVKLVIPRKE